jgi:hypothetical protein
MQSLISPGGTIELPSGRFDGFRRRAKVGRGQPQKARLVVAIKFASVLIAIPLDKRYGESQRSICLRRPVANLPSTDIRSRIHDQR